MSTPSGRWPPPQEGPTVIHVLSVLPEHDHQPVPGWRSNHERFASGWECTPARLGPNGFWEGIDDCVSIDVAAGVARRHHSPARSVVVHKVTHERFPDLLIRDDGDLVVDAELVDGVHLFCSCGKVITAEMAREQCMHEETIDATNHGAHRIKRQCVRCGHHIDGGPLPPPVVLRNLTVTDIAIIDEKHALNPDARIVLVKSAAKTRR
jgi:hypothetical protein